MGGVAVRLVSVASGCVVGRDKCRGDAGVRVRVVGRYVMAVCVCVFRAVGGR